MLLEQGSPVFCAFWGASVLSLGRFGSVFAAVRRESQFDDGTMKLVVHCFMGRWMVY